MRDQPAHQDGVDLFFARVRARTSWLRLASRRRMTRVGSSGIQSERSPTRCPPPRASRGRRARGSRRTARAPQASSRSDQPRRPTLASSTIATSEVAVDVQPDRSHLIAPPSLLTGGRTGGQTTQTDPCSQHNGASRRSGHRKVGLEAHAAITTCPACLLPEARVPVSRP